MNHDHSNGPDDCIDCMIAPPTAAVWLSPDELGLLKAGLAACRIELKAEMAKADPDTRSSIQAVIKNSLALTDRLTAAQLSLH